MPKILVVDDAQFLRLRLSKLLKEHGYETIEAENGDKALAQYAQHSPDAVLLDITMPDKDGLQVLGELREHDPDARVVMLTALGQQSIVLQAIKAGARDFIVKPYEPERVLTAIAKAMK
ncbi:MAG TPA: response regulator [Chloroflexi bacterium]|jgi:two-component system chemotaxis response regulator CheY|nr:response regulator [Chloroflexota bacterium]